jgi:hypothetical protein
MEFLDGGFLVFRLNIKLRIAFFGESLEIDFYVFGFVEYENVIFIF